MMGHHWTDVFGIKEEAIASVALDGETVSIDGPVTVGDMQQFGDNRLVKEFDRFEPKPLRDKLIWVGVDLDGTLAYPTWTPENPTSEIGDPIWENVAKLHELVALGYKAIIHTSRGWTDYQVIEQWLNHYQIPFKEIQCGKPLYAAYIDDRAVRADDESWLPNGV
jgi:hypothetical protein